MAGERERGGHCVRRGEIRASCEKGEDWSFRAKKSDNDLWCRETPGRLGPTISLSGQNPV